MNNIPQNIYETVHEFAVALTNASEASDAVLYGSIYESLRTFYDEQASIGHSHPFLTEALADYTDDTADAVRLYELALEQARAFRDEPTYTKMISLAQHLLELGRREQAEAYFQDGRAEALRHADTLWIEDADRLLQMLPD